MKTEALITSLERHGATIVGLLADVDDASARWRPEPERWSLVEIASHLVDEERDDFRARVQSTLEDPARAWPGIDPEGWARDRDYRARSLDAVVSEFERERARSLSWLRGLDAPAWDRAYEHPSLGALRAGDLLASWAAHDLLHLRQLVGVKLAMLPGVVAPYSLDYAT